MRELLARLLDWTRRDRLDRELREELLFHRQQLERDARTDRHDADAQQQSARRRMGNLTGVREAARERWSVPLLDNLQQDVRYALRGLLRSPAFTLTIVVTLALGLGVNTAVFTLVDRLFNRLPAGVANAASLRRLYLSGETRIRDQFNYPEWQDLQAVMSATPATAYAADSARIGDQDNETYVSATYSDAAYWPVLGVVPAMGRTYTRDEARIEVPTNVVVISHSLWQRRFGGRKDIIGQPLKISGNRYDIIGVTPASFTGIELDANDLWLPLGAMPMTAYSGGRVWYEIRGIYRLHVVLRASDSNAPNNLDANLARAFRIGSVASGRARDSTAIVISGSIIAARGPLKRGPELTIATRLAWVSALVLLIACANVANLLLTRLIERRREIAVRLALGVSRQRLATQFLVETLVLTSVGAVGAVVVGSWSGSLLRSQLLPGIYWRGSALESRHLLGLVTAALVTGILIALVPILHVRKFAGGDVLKGGQRSTSAGGNRLRNTLIVGQTAIAVVLLTGAALCAESLRQVLAVDVGVDTQALISSMPRMLGSRGGEDSQRAKEAGAGLTTAAERIATIPGVEAVALAAHAPMRGYYLMEVKIPGIDSAIFKQTGVPVVANISPEYWQVAGLKAVRGRLTTRQDVEGAPSVVVINETMANKVWQGRDPIGRCVILNENDAICRTIVGIVRDAHRLRIVEEATPQLYAPLSQGNRDARARPPAAIIVRTSPSQLPSIMQQMRRELNNALPNAELALTTMDETLKPLYRPWQLGALLFTVLASLGLLVAAIGLYGVIAYGVRQRLREIGIRMALGAERRRIVLNVVRQGVLNVVGGLVVGTLLTLMLARFMTALLYGTSLRDPRILAGVAGAMLVTAIVASIVPAWVAAAVDPVSALREE